MLFPSPLSNGQRTTLRTSRYWARAFVCLNLPEVVFRAEAAESITDDPFMAFAWDNADIGAYTDVWEGMVAYISATNDIRSAKHRGRVRLAPDASTFYIDRNDVVLNTGDKIIVVRDTDLFKRERLDTLVDGSITYHDLPPVLEGLPMAIVLYDADGDGQVTYTPDVTGIPVDAAATSIDTWLWSISGAGTSSIDDDSLQAPEITFEAGYHYLLRVQFVDDNGIANYVIVHVYAITRTFDAPAVTSILVGSITGDVDDGWTANLTAYADLTTLVDRTHCAVFAVEHFGDNSSTPMVSNVWMNGRIRSSSLQTEGSAEAGRLQQATFTVEGLTAYLRRLTLPNDIVRPTATPDEWGEITTPTPWRMAVYVLWAYTTLTNIGSLSVEEDAFAAWQIGGEPRGIDGGNALDVLTNILAPIKAAVNVAPSGAIHLARIASFVADRSGLDLITTLTLADLLEYRVDLDSSRTTSQVIAWGGVYDSTTGQFVLYTASAPSLVGSEGDIRELTREILTTDSSILDAQEELGMRASNEYAFNNAKPLMSLTLFDSYAGLLIPTTFQRWAALLPASSNTLGRAWGATDYWQLQSVSLGLDPKGTVAARGEWYAETAFDSHQVESNLLPDNLSDMNPVLPDLPNEPALPTDPLENYPTDTPSLEEYQPGDPFSGMVAYTPFPPDEAADAARRQGRVGCKVLQLLFSNSANTASTWTTVLAAAYLITASGSAILATEAWTYTQDFENDGLGDWVVANGTYTPGVGVVNPGSGGLPYTADITIEPPSGWGGSTLTQWSIEASSTTADSGAFRGLYYPDEATFQDVGGGETGDYTLSDAASVAQPAEIHAQISNDTIAGSNVIKRVTLSGTGPNPFTGDPTTPSVIEGDAFYSYRRTEDGEIDLSTAALLAPGQGLYIDNSLYTPSNGVPPFNPSHRYPNLLFTGTNNVLNARMVLNSYAGVQHVYLTLDVCRKS